MTPYSLFVVDDEETIRDGLAIALEPQYRVDVFENAENAIKALPHGLPDLILLDIGLPGISGIDALKDIKRQYPDVLVIMITAYEDVTTVVSAMKLGAYDYIVKPIQMDGLEVTLKNALESIRLRKEVRMLQEKFLKENLPCFIGESDTVQDMMEFLQMVAKSPDTPILILGETGTGKELLANAVHYRSPNFKGNFVTVNCAAIPKDLIESELFGYEEGAFSGAGASGKKGLIEDAANGTLFLDEIGDLSLEAQAKLLRFLESGEFYRIGGTEKQKIRTRVVSATNKDIVEMTQKDLFRKDLFFRISVIQLKVPSLTERRNDIILLAQYFLSRFSDKFGKRFTGISNKAAAVLKNHNWTGNVRELKNRVERGVLIGTGPELMPHDLGVDDFAKKEQQENRPGEFPVLTPDGIDFPALQNEFEKHYFDEAVKITGGNESKAAKLLNLNPHTFRYRRKKLQDK